MKKNESLDFLGLGTDSPAYLKVEACADKTLDYPHASAVELDVRIVLYRLFRNAPEAMDDESRQQSALSEVLGYAAAKAHQARLRSDGERIDESLDLIRESGLADPDLQELLTLRKSNLRNETLEVLKMHKYKINMLAALTQVIGRHLRIALSAKRRRRNGDSGGGPTVHSTRRSRSRGSTDSGSGGNH